MVKKRKDSAAVEDAGLIRAEQLVNNELRWIWRGQPERDYGIDAQLEVVNGEAVTGRLLAAQVKSGSSYLDEPTPDGWWYRLNQDDLAYWLDHSLPVIVLLHDPSDGNVYWQSVTQDKIVSTGKGNKLLVPASQQLTGDAEKALAELAQGKPYEVRIRRLRLALPWMHLLRTDRRLLLRAEDWVNKTAGRGAITVVSVDDANEDEQVLASWWFWAGLHDFEAQLPKLFPWAELSLHSETYDDADHDLWEEEAVIVDYEGDRYELETYVEWRQRFDDDHWRPYKNGAGEVDYYLLEMTLGPLGEAFLLVDDYASAAGLVLTPNE